MDTSRGSDSGRVHGTVLLGRRSCVVVGDLRRRHFLTRDSSLRPLLAATLVFTALGSALTFTRHREPGPLISTIAAGLWIYVFAFAVGASPHAAARDDAIGGHEHGASHPGLGGRSALVWFGLAVLIAAQVWDVLRMRVGRRSAGAAA